MAVKANMCDDCLILIMQKLPVDHIKILNVLKKMETKNIQSSINETKIIPQIPEMTKFKFQQAVNTLEILGLIGKNTTVRPFSYYATNDCRRLLFLYKKSIKDSMNE